MHTIAKRVIPVLLMLLLGAISVWYFMRGQAEEKNGVLSGSGTIEATQVRISAEIGGRVVEVTAKEGELVQAGQVLVRLDDQLLQAQLAQAQAQLALAKANYALVAAGTPPEQRDLAVAQAELEKLAAQQKLDELQDTYQLIAAKTLLEIAQADKLLDQAGKRVTTLNTASDPADIDAARATVVLAKDKLDRAREDFAKYEKKPEDNLIRATYLAKMAEAQQKYDAAVERLNNLLGRTNKLELSIAEANQILVKAQLADARRRYELVKDGPDENAIALAKAQLKSAEAHLQAAQAGPTTEQLALAQAQIDAVQASIDVLKAQIEKLTLVAPIQGNVLVRSIEPGEIALPNAPLLTLADLSELSITIYLPEDRYGAVKFGDLAQVNVDSFPNETFTARVVQIADQAEFTPRNVQTQEGRRTTVFAIKLLVENKDGKLKPGMPADVTFK